MNIDGEAARLSRTSLSVGMSVGPGGVMHLSFKGKSVFAVDTSKNSIIFTPANALCCGSINAKFGVVCALYESSASKFPNLASHSKYVPSDALD
ncbi:hypothetical protein YB2330_003521 [Saitoella coloradoensis]